jgi:hypothetical protein
MAVKNDSNWLDNSKIRNELSAFNMAVKNVYTHFRSDEGLIIPLTMDCIRVRPVFDKSFFMRTGGTHFEFLDKTGVDCEELNIALKTKAYDYKKKDDKHYLCKDDSEHMISVDMKPNQLEDMKHYKGLLEYRELVKNTPVGSYELTLEDIGLLSLYHVVTRDIAEYKGIKVHLIMTKELFPMLKRVNSIIIDTYKTEGLPENIYAILIRSDAKTWSFNSIHKIIVT